MAKRTVPIVACWKVDPRATLPQARSDAGWIVVHALEGVDLWTGQMHRVRTGIALAPDADYYPLFLPHPSSPYVIVAGSETNPANAETILHVVNLGPSLLKLERGSPVAVLRLLANLPFDFVPMEEPR